MSAALPSYLWRLLPPLEGQMVGFHDGQNLGRRGRGWVLRWVTKVSSPVWCPPPPREGTQPSQAHSGRKPTRVHTKSNRRSRSPHQWAWGTREPRHRGASEAAWSSVGWLSTGLKHGLSTGSQEPQVGAAQSWAGQPFASSVCRSPSGRAFGRSSRTEVPSAPHGHLRPRVASPSPPVLAAAKLRPCKGMGSWACSPPRGQEQGFKPLKTWPRKLQKLGLTLCPYHTHTHAIIIDKEGRGRRGGNIWRRCICYSTDRGAGLMGVDWSPSPSRCIR